MPSFLRPRQLTVSQPAQFLLILIVAISATLFAAPGEVQGQSIFRWILGSQRWEDPSSWSPGSGPPANRDTALFDSTTTSTEIVDWDGNTGDQTISKLLVSKGDYRFENSASQPYSLTLLSNDLYGLEITDQGQLALAGLNLGLRDSGVLVGSTGTFVLEANREGVSSNLSLNSDLRIQGDFSILDRSTADTGTGSTYIGGASASETALAQVRGNGAQLQTAFLRVGQVGDGVLTIADGGNVAATSALISGDSYIQVTGADAQLNINNQVGTITMGQNAWLIAQQGGSVSAAELAAGSGTNADVNVSLDFGNATFDRLNLGVRNNAQGTLSATGESRIATETTTFGQLDSALGQATIRDDTIWDNSGDLVLGGSQSAAGGTGVLTLRDNAELNVGGTTQLWSGGRLLIEGGQLNTHHYDNSAGGQLVHSGGTLNITGAGGTFTPRFNSYTVDGDDSPTLMVSDQASIDLAGSLTVGNGRIGNLRVESGGTVSQGNAYLGFSASGTGVASVTGQGSSWNTQSLYVGRNGLGDLQIEDGGVVSSTEGLLAANSGSAGSVNVLGGNQAGQWNLSGNLFVGGTSAGSGGGGLLNVNGGSVDVGGSTTLFSGSSLVLRDGQMTTRGLDNSADGTISLRGGTLIVQGNGSVLDAGTTFNMIDRSATSSTTPALLLTDNASADFLSVDTLTVGDFQSGRMAVAGGSTLATRSAVLGASDPSAHGIVSVRDAGSRWNVSGNGLRVGQAGIGDVWVRDGGLLVTTVETRLGTDASGTGTIELNDSGSLWASGTVSARVGERGRGIVEIRNGAIARHLNIVFADEAGSVGHGLVYGSGSRWTNRHVTVGVGGTAAFEMWQGGQTTTAESATIGLLEGGDGNVKVNGAGSSWELTGNGQGNLTGLLHVGRGGHGDLRINSGGLVSNHDAVLGVEETGVGQVTLTGAGSTWNNRNHLTIGDSGQGTVEVLNGSRLTSDAVAIGLASPGVGALEVQGMDSVADINGDFNVGVAGSGSLLVTSGGTVYSGDSLIGSSPDRDSWALISGTESVWNASSLTVCDEGSGSLGIADGGQVVSTGILSFSVGEGSSSTLDLGGSGSRLDAMGGVIAGAGGQADLNIDSSAWLETAGLNLVGVAGKSVDMSVSYATWSNSGTAIIGSASDASLNIVAAQTRTGNLYLGTGAEAHGEVLVDGDGQFSLLEVHGDLGIGGTQVAAGTGQLTIRDGGSVSVEGTTYLHAGGNVILESGSFDFGQTSLEEFSRFDARSGILYGDVLHDGFTNVQTITPLRTQFPDVNVENVYLTNSGTLYSSADDLRSSLRNLAGGELFTTDRDLVRFQGHLVNAGEINNVGGTIRFEKTGLNEADGFIAGRGSFIAQEGWTNQGIMAFSGDADIFGDLVNEADGQIVTSGTATTTFYDDVVHNGMEIRTAADSQTVFFGEYSGAGDFTGQGTVFFEGDLRPGNSPDIVDFGGDVVLGSRTWTELELAGMDYGDFDQLRIAGDLSLDGELSVALLDNFQLQQNQEFLVASVAGQLWGQFDGLDNGDRVGTFDGQDLFIRYLRSSGSGGSSGVVLFTPVPEPGTAGIAGLVMLAICFRRRRA